MKEIMLYLADAEGIKIVRHNTEIDITAPYGIYRGANSYSEIFKFIDVVALECGIVGKSANWNSSDIASVNKRISDLYSWKIQEYAEKFYEEYMLDAHLDLFPAEAKLAMFSMFTHSSLNAWKAVQRAINNLIDSEHLDTEELKDDGSFGEKTKSALIKFQEIYQKNNLFGYLLESQMVFEMVLIYAQLAIKNPEKNLKYLIGWNNRMDKLLDSK